MIWKRLGLGLGFGLGLTLKPNPNPNPNPNLEETVDLVLGVLDLLLQRGELLAHDAVLALEPEVRVRVRDRVRIRVRVRVRVRVTNLEPERRLALAR